MESAIFKFRSWRASDAAEYLNSESVSEIGNGLDAKIFFKKVLSTMYYDHTIRVSANFSDTKNIL